MWGDVTYVLDVLFFAFTERSLGSTILFLALGQPGFLLRQGRQLLHVNLLSLRLTAPVAPPPEAFLLVVEPFLVAENGINIQHYSSIQRNTHQSLCWDLPQNRRRWPSFSDARARRHPCSWIVALDGQED